MSDKPVMFTVLRSTMSPHNTPCCGGNYMPDAPEHSEPHAEIYQCWSCAAHFAVVDDAITKIGEWVTFTEIPGQAPPGLNLQVVPHPYNSV